MKESAGFRLDAPHNGDGTTRDDLDRKYASQPSEALHVGLVMPETERDIQPDPSSDSTTHMTVIGSRNTQK